MVNFYIHLRNDFFNLIQKLKEAKAKKIVLHQTKQLLHINKIRRELIEWEKIITNYICEKGLIYKLLLKTQ